MKVKLYYFAFLISLVQSFNILSVRYVGPNCTPPAINPSNQFFHDEPCTSPLSVGADGKSLAADGTTPLYPIVQVYSVRTGNSADNNGKPATPAQLAAQGIYPTTYPSAYWASYPAGISGKVPQPALYPHPSEKDINGIARFAYGNINDAEFYTSAASSSNPVHNPKYGWADPLKLMWRSLKSPYTDIKAVQFMGDSIKTPSFKVKNNLTVPIYVALYYITGNIFDITIGSDKILRVPQLLIDSSKRAKISEVISGTPLNSNASTANVTTTANNMVNPAASSVYTLAPKEMKTLTYTIDPGMVACKTFDEIHDMNWVGCCDCLYADLVLVASTDKNKLQEVISKDTFTSITTVGASDSTTSTAVTLGDQSLAAVKVIGGSTGADGTYNLYNSIPSVLTFQIDQGGQLLWNLNEPSPDTPVAPVATSTPSTGTTQSSDEGSSPKSKPLVYKSKGGLPS